MMNNSPSNDDTSVVPMAPQRAVLADVLARLAMILFGLVNNVRSRVGQWPMKCNTVASRCTKTAVSRLYSSRLCWSEVRDEGQVL